MNEIMKISSSLTLEQVLFVIDILKNCEKSTTYEVSSVFNKLAKLVENSLINDLKKDYEEYNIYNVKIRNYISSLNIKEINNKKL